MAMRSVLVLVAALALPVAAQAQRSPWGGRDSPGGLLGGDPMDADTDRDGRATHDEIWTWLRQRLDHADRDRDGRLSPQELPDRPGARATFRAADADRNGHVTPEELRPMADMWFRARDANGDGALTRQEVSRRRVVRPASP
jgi:hypothetical protein